MKKVFIVSGKLQSGKNQFGEYLEQIIQLDGISVKQDAFAQSVKDWCLEDFKLLISYLNKQATKLTEGLKAHKTYLKERYPANEKFVSEPLDDLIYLAEKIKTEDKNFYEDKNDITRTLLQIYGTDIFRDRVDYNFWVKNLINKIKESKEDIIIITDCRFPNEIELLDDEPDFNVIAIRVERNIDRNDSVNEHESEKALDNYKNFNYIVENNGTLEDLWHSAKLIFDENKKIV